MSDKKILSQSGISLADAYDIEGSIAGVEQLDSEEVKVVHEMGGTMFSERLGGLLRRTTTGAIAQNIAISQVLNLPNVPIRIYGVAVLTDDSSRLSRISVSLRDQEATIQEHPIWIWNGTASQTVDITDDGTLTTLSLLRPNPDSAGDFPYLTFGTTSRNSIGQVAFRGLTTGFGAGTVTATMLLYHGFSQLGGISSYGIPIPSW